MRTLETFWQRDEFERVERWRAQGVTWANCAIRLGRPLGSLKTQMCRYRQGKLTEMLARRDRDAIVVEMAENGCTVQEIHAAVHPHTTIQNTHAMLTRRGFDPEMRREYRDGAVGSGAGALDFI